MRIRRLGVYAALLATATAMPTLASAQGIRAGVSVDPEEFVFGGHVESDPLVDRLVFRPNAEVGVGDNRVLISLNFEFVYKVPLEDNPWVVYVGAGPALNITSFGDEGRRGRDDTDVGGGFNILVGLEHPGGLFTEFKVGAIDSPNLRFTVGYSFN